VGQRVQKNAELDVEMTAVKDEIGMSALFGPPSETLHSLGHHTGGDMLCTSAQKGDRELQCASDNGWTSFIARMEAGHPDPSIAVHYYCLLRLNA